MKFKLLIYNILINCHILKTTHCMHLDHVSSILHLYVKEVIYDIINSLKNCKHGNQIIYK